MLTDLRSPNIDAPSECGSLHGGPTSSKMAVMLGGSFGPSRSGVVIVLLVVLIVLALVGSVAVSPLLWALVVVLVLFAVLGRGRYYGRRG